MMISLVIVSHSHVVAQGVRELAAQMAPPELVILAVGGICTSDTPDPVEAPDQAPDQVPVQHALGSDALAIAAVIQQGWTPAGVLILVDLGSSVISAETALEMVAPEMAAGCWISNAPLVEGAVIAAVEAGLGHDLATVNAAAEAAATLVKVSRTPPPE